MDRLNARLDQYRQQFAPFIQELDQEGREIASMQRTSDALHAYNQHMATLLGFNASSTRSPIDAGLIWRAANGVRGDASITKEAFEAHIREPLQTSIAQYISNTRQTHQNLTASDQKFLEDLSRCNTFEEIIRCRADRTGLASIDLSTRTLETYVASLYRNNCLPFLVLQPETAAFMQQLAAYNPESDTEALTQFLASYSSEQKVAFTADINHTERAFAQMTNSTIPLPEPVGMAVYFIPIDTRFICPADDSPEMANWIRICRDPQLTRQFLESFRDQITIQARAISLDEEESWVLADFLIDERNFPQPHAAPIILPHFIYKLPGLFRAIKSDDLKTRVVNTWNTLVSGHKQTHP
jgi:hypothetical protein